MKIMSDDTSIASFSDELKKLRFGIVMLVGVYVIAILV